MDKHENLPVAGYKPETTETCELVTQSKYAEERVLRMIDALIADPDNDGRWLAIGRTHIEQGFMAINRGLFTPDRVILPEDRAAVE